MRATLDWLAAYMAFLCRIACRIACVCPETLRRGRRGNLPPPSGGVASY